MNQIMESQLILTKYPFLGCPICHEGLSSADAELICRRCGRVFSAHNGVPILLPEQVSFSPGAAASHHQSAPGLARRILTYGRHRGDFHPRIVELCAGGHILSIGGGPRRDRPEYINLNLAPMDGVDIVGDAADLPCQHQSLDGVVCTAVLEHVRDPWRVMGEIHRVLRPGGFVYIEIPFLQHFHPSPEDFWRFTIQGTRELGRDFSQIDLGIVNGPMFTVVEFVESYLMLLPIKHRITRDLIKGAVRLSLYPLRALEPLLLLSREAHSVANAFYFLGQKQALTELPSSEAATRALKAPSLALMHSENSGSVPSVREKVR